LKKRDIDNKNKGSGINGLLPESHSENLRPQISAFVISKTNETYYQDSVEIKAKEFFHPIYNWPYGLNEPSFHLIYLEGQPSLGLRSVPEQNFNVLNSNSLVLILPTDR